MRKFLVIASVVASIVLLVCGVGLLSVYEASQQVPPFYQEALARDPDEQQEARDEFIAQATALASDLHRSGRWQTLFTVEQINAWLALELDAHYPALLPGELREPRVEISPSEATIACRYETPEISTVLSLSVEAYLHEPTVLALRICKARAGSLPVPLGQVLDAISHAARELKLRLEWSKTNGDPVALITFSGLRDTRSNSLELQAIELREGELFVSGVIGRDARPAIAKAGQQRDDTAEEVPADQPLVGAAEKETRQK